MANSRKVLVLPIQILSLLILFSFLLPVFRIGGYGVKLDLLLLGPLLLALITQNFNAKKDNFIKSILRVSICVFFSMFFSNSIGNYFFNDSNFFYFPAEYVHFLSKVLILYCFYLVSREGYLSISFFLKCIEWIFLIAVLVGLFQILNLPFVNKVTEIYALSENQVLGISSLNSRVFSINGNILTWAGWSSIIVIYSIIICNNKLYKTLLFCLGIINLIYSSSRGALIALMLSLIIFLLIKAIVERKISTFFINSLVTLIVGCSTLLSLTYFFGDRFFTYIERFSVLDDAILKSGRNVQMRNIYTIFSEDSWNFIFGIGKNTVDSIGLMEVEPFFILFSYGVVGFMLQYYFVGKVVAKGIVLSKESKYGLFLVTSVIFYIIFSFGFFFLREIYSGLLFWSIVGFFIGYHDRVK
ncbi:hypothetical protein HX091_15885 [Myroides odoratimimus]|uniref:hypothetical protein n=1 Tax=Myroides odoratimimus TaxID=76832 RepID=UPI002578B17D|nr:hypothetical protein [Myroides odoratimimus]MDM1527397.1 hypothetical protein [Myroides odoratimimus]